MNISELEKTVNKLNRTFTINLSKALQTATSDERAFVNLIMYSNIDVVTLCLGIAIPSWDLEQSYKMTSIGLYNHRELQYSIELSELANTSLITFGFFIREILGDVEK